MSKIYSLFPMILLSDGIICVGWLKWCWFFQLGKKRFNKVSLVIRGKKYRNESETDSFLHRSEADDDEFFGKLSLDKDF